MALKKDEWVQLEDKVNEVRRLCLDTTVWAGSGHIGGALSALDCLVLLYYKYANFDPKDFKNPDRDRVVVSKGHIGIGIAPLFAHLGLIKKEDLKTFNLTNSHLGIHLDSNKVDGLDASTGSLGHGSNLALGMALAAKVSGKNYKVFTILGDGECNEGSVWEAAMATTSFNATNLITIVDRNHCMIDGKTEDVMKLEPFADKWTAFGFDTIVVDGQNMNELAKALEKGINNPEKPVCIIMDTKKGAGIDYMEDDYKWHYGAINNDLYKKAVTSLNNYHKNRVERAKKEGK